MVMGAYKELWFSTFSKKYYFILISKYLQRTGLKNGQTEYNKFGVNVYAIPAVLCKENECDFKYH